MTVLVLFCVAMLSGGIAISRRALRADGDANAWRPGPWEYAATSSLASVALALAVGWLLLLTSMLGRGALLGMAGVVFLVSARSTFAAFPRLNAKLASPGASVVTAAAVLAVVLWMGLNVWAGSVVYFQNHDALGYHMPRAALLAKAGAFQVFDMPDERTTWPIDFELLLAETIVLAKTDRLASFVPVFGYGLLLLQAAALVERWWGRGLHVVTVTLVVAAMPIALLHASTHKNDTFECAMTLAALRLAAAWTVTRVRWLPIASAAAAILAIGFKVSGGAVVLATAALLVLGLGLHIQKGFRPSRRELAVFLLAASSFTFLLGGWTYVYNLATIKRPFLDLRLDPPMTWGHFSNVWRYLYASLVAPYATGIEVGTIPVPWSDRRWYMAAPDPFFSNFGLVVPVLLAALPFALYRYRRRTSAGRFERAMTLVPCLAIGFTIVCFDMKPEGFYLGSTRFLLFLPPLLLGFTLAPAIRELAAARPRAAIALAGAAAILFVSQAYTYGYRSVEGIVHLADEVEARPALSRSGPQLRAGFVVDRAAGPTDVVAIDAGYDSFSYPLYGKALTRRVRYLHSERDTLPTIDDDVRWVAIDRAWHCFFGSPEFRDFGDWSQAIGRGRPTPADRRVFDLMSADPRFKLVWQDQKFNQAVFLRITKP